ncbi:arginine-glutamic acid dipeptide repeats protein-like isoform X2 [Paramacrobiotus metropolitanus]|uniref:arginine-glutamic acid dipeptide repeats protein-like isoform X2 n=1 Tax=Paramacrobiotus metropolitanus TaxID=2943436 RepID=UPI002445BFC2|nr:arginine-glutamic acid dipeptide repeats protein-like isoform X2 [Paramacrobiotus metropolitanus]
MHPKPRLALHFLDPMKSLVKSNMDLSLKPSTSACTPTTSASICSSLPLNSYNNNMEKETKFTSTLNNYPSGTTVQPVSCMVGKKERHLGLVYLNANGVYFEYVCANSVKYKPGDSAYLESSCRRDHFEPFNICTIQEFFRHKRDGCLYVSVKGFYRLSDLRIPEGEYQRYIVQDRSNANNSGGQDGLSSHIQSRELVAADGVCDSYPVSALRGLSEVRHFRDINAAKEFVAKPDTFFYIFGYNSKSGLAPPQGEIRVGPKHQAKLPELREDVAPAQMPEKCPEECMWRPKETANDHINMYVNAARSVFAHRLCIYTDNNYPAPDVPDVNIYKDEARQKAFDLLYKHNYNMEAALHAVIVMQQQENNKWSEEDTKNFVKGVRKWDKNFFRIRKELLPHHTTAELIEFYYQWKKTPAGNKLMKSVRKPPRRPTNMMRRMRGRPNRTTLSSDFVDLNPSSDEDRESEESDKDLSTYQCSNCNATESKDWHPTTNKSAILCNDCRLFFKKYGELRPPDDRENNASFNAKSAPEEEGNENINTSNGNGKNGPTTRRTNNSAGRSKSGNTSPDTTAAAVAEKAQRSPGTASVSSGGSAETKQTKKGRGKGGKAAVKVEETKVSPVTETAPPIQSTTNSRKRRKTSGSDKPTATGKCDVPKEDIPGDVGAVSENKPDVTSSKSASNSIPLLPSPVANLPTSPPGRPTIKVEDIQVKSPGLVKSPKNVVGIDLPLALIKTEPGVKSEPKAIGIVRPMAATLHSGGKTVAPAPKPERNEIKQEKMEKPEKKERIKEEPIIKVEIDTCTGDLPPEMSRDMPLSPMEQARDCDPKPDHAEVGFPDKEVGKIFMDGWGKLIRVWNREPNSCARTDHTFAPSHPSPLMAKREKQPRGGPSQTAASTSKTTIKSPAPMKEDKRTPGSSQAANSSERDRDARSTVPSGPGLPMPTPRVVDTPPRMTVPSRHPGLSPHGPEMMHPGMTPFGPMSSSLYHEQQQQMFRLQQSERDRLMRSGNVPPGMLPGHNPSSLDHMMELQRRMQSGAAAAGPMHPFMNLYPNLTPQSMMEQQQREALMERMMLPPPGPNPGMMHPAMHGMHPDMAGPTQEQMAQLYFAAANGSPFARPPFMGQPHPGMSGPDAATLHALGRQNIFEQEAAYMQAQAHAIQQAQAVRAMEEQHHAMARIQQQQQTLQMMMNPNPHEFMSRLGG